MKSIEYKADKYNKGIKLLTLDKLSKIKQYIVDNYLHKDEAY